MKPRRLLIIRPDRIGDVIISSSCLSLLHQYLPDTELFFAARPVMAPLFSQHSFSRFLALPNPKLNFIQRVKMLRNIFTTYHFDCVVSLYPDSAIYVAAWLARISHHIGNPLFGFSWMLSKRIPDHRHLCLVHEAVNNFALLQSFDIPMPFVEELRASIQLPLDAAISLQKKLQGIKLESPYFCFHLGAFSPVVRWPVAHFVTLAKKLQRERNVQIVLIGEENEMAAHTEFRMLAGDLSYIDMRAQLNLAETGFLLRNAACLIVRDTGPSHLAAAVECPVVVLFGRLNPPFGPKRWAPLAAANQLQIVCTTSVQRRYESDKVFFQRAFGEITVEQVMTAVNKLLPHDVFFNI